MAAPYVFSQSRHLFEQTLRHDPGMRVVRVAVLGDSTADPIAAGRSTIEGLNFVAAARLTSGIIPETPPCRPSSDIGPLYTGNNQGGAATRVASDKILPGFAPLSVTSAALGIAWTLHNFGESSANPDNIGPEWFRVGSNPATATVGLQLFGATNASSGEFAWYANPLAAVGDSPYFAGSVTASGTTAMGLETGTFGVKSATVSLPLAIGFTHPNTYSRGSDAVKPADLVCGIFKSTVNTNGLVFHGLGIGGYKASSFLLNHSNAQAMAVALDYRVIWHRFGINDDGNAVSAASWKASTLANIDWWDAAYSGVRQLIHVVDPGCYASSDTGLRDAYATAAYEIAQVYPHVMSLNLYTLGLAADWDASGVGRYTVDNVHPNAYGARWVASHALALMSGDRPLVELDAGDALTLADIKKIALATPDDA